MDRLNHPTKKYTLKNRCKPTLQPKFLREYFFRHPKNATLPFFLIYFFQRTGFVRNRTDIASNVNCFGQSVCKLETIHHRTDSKPAGNKGLPQCGVQCLIKRQCFLFTFVVGGQFSAIYSRTDGNPRNVSRNALTTLQTLNDREDFEQLYI